MTQQAWEKVCIDYARPFLGTMLLIIVNAQQYWLDVQPTIVATLIYAIGKFQATFTTHGFPATLVTDNGRIFFQQSVGRFLDKVWYSLKENCSVPPARSNLLVEGAVQTLKHGIRKMAGDGCLETQVLSFLFKNRITSHSTTGFCQTSTTPRSITSRH